MAESNLCDMKEDKRWPELNLRRFVGPDCTWPQVIPIVSRLQRMSFSSFFLLGREFFKSMSLTCIQFTLYMVSTRQ